MLLRRYALVAVAALLGVPTQAAAQPTPNAPEVTTSTETTPGPTESTPTPTPTQTTPTPTPTATTPKPKPASPKYVEKSIVVGTTATGRKIRAYYTGWPSVTNARTLVVIGQMHGNEKAGLQTVDWLRTWQKPRRYTAMWLIPTMNPDGNAHSRRTNSRGVDLNRNFPTSGGSSRGRGAPPGVASARAASVRPRR